MYKDYGFQSSIPPHTHSYLFDPIRKILDPEKNKKILDVGCGNGWLALALIKEEFDVYGIDASPSGIEIANKQAPGRFFVQDINDEQIPIPLRGIPFDTIISTEVIEHLYSPLKYLEFCRRIIEPQKGEIIISTPFHGYIKNLALSATGKMDKHFTVLWEGGHIKFWSRATLEKAMEMTGFTPKQFVGCGRVPFLWKSMVIKAAV